MRAPFNANNATDPLGSGSISTSLTLGYSGRLLNSALITQRHWIAPPYFIVYTRFAFQNSNITLVHNRK